MTERLGLLEWREMSLGDLCDFRAGSVFKLKYQGETRGDYPFIKVSDMNLPSNGVRILDANNWIDQPTAQEIKARPFPRGTIVFAKIGEALKQNRLRIIVRPTIIDNNMMGAVPRTDIVDFKCLFYLMKQFDFGEVASGTALPYLTVPTLNELPLSLPPLTEQRAIAHILGTLDDKIELNRRMNETLEEMARALFKSWFVDFDPVRANMEGRDTGLPPDVAALFPDRLVESELGEIPEGWEVGCFGDIVEQNRDKESPFASPDTVFRHFSIPAFDKDQWPQTERGEDIKSQKSCVPPEVILLSKLNPEIERVWFVDVEPDEKAICSTEFLVLQARPPFQRSYVYCLARSPLFRQQVESLVTGTSKSHQRAQARAVLALEATIPSAPVIRAFDRQASALLDRSVCCRRETTSLAALHDTLLPKLISGEIRVNSWDEESEAIEKHP